MSRSVFAEKLSFCSQLLHLSLRFFLSFPLRMALSGDEELEAWVQVEQLLAALSNAGNGGEKDSPDKSKRGAVAQVAYTALQCAEKLKTLSGARRLEITRLQQDREALLKSNKKAAKEK